MQWLVIVFLQDSALLQPRYPDLPVYKHTVFKMAEWEPFAEAVRRRVETEEVIKLT